MKIAVIGADGQLGTDLCKVIDKSDLVPLTIKDLDIIDPQQSRELLLKIKPQMIINTAAYNRVDDSEDNDAEAYSINAHGAKNLAVISREIGSALVHISTDYVFDGDHKSPYKESDPANPKTAYGISKLAGEQYVKYINEKHYLVRTSGLYGLAGCLGKGGGNFVENMIKRAKGGQQIKVVADEIVGPTYTMDLARKIMELMQTGKFGLYHITNGGACSWWEFADKIFSLLKIDIKVIKASSSEFKSKAHRPNYSVLENSNLKKIGVEPMRPWPEALKAYLKEREQVS
ncbi:MAG: dTDP-4-dehydrorhamnose reductase [Candidatus Margulisiibacteriota bacterium]